MANKGTCGSGCSAERLQRSRKNTKPPHRPPTIGGAIISPMQGFDPSGDALLMASRIKEDRDEANEQADQNAGKER